MGFDHYPITQFLGDEQFDRREHVTLFGLFEESRARCLLTVAELPRLREGGLCEKLQHEAQSASGLFHASHHHQLH